MLNAVCQSYSDSHDSENEFGSLKLSFICWLFQKVTLMRKNL